MCKRTPTAIIALLVCSILVLPLVFLQGCAGKEEIDPRAREYVEEELATMLDLMFYIDEMNPSVWMEAIYPRDNAWDSEAIGMRIEESLRTYEKVKEYMDLAQRGDISAEVYNDLFHIRQYMFLGAAYLKVAVELIRMDVYAMNDVHEDIVDEMTYNFFNIYRWDFFDEYNRIAEKYGLPKRGE